MRFIGSKTRLLTQIDELLTKHLDGSEKTFADIFSGSNVVGEYFKTRYAITTNDLLYFSYALAKGEIDLNSQPSFTGLFKLNIHNPFDYFNQYDISNYSGDFITNNYSSAGKEKRLYFTVANAKRIDFIRVTIQKWLDNNDITSNEYFYLLASLIEAVPFVSNTTGTYGAYLKNFNDKRATKPLKLEPMKIHNNKQQNRAFNEDANELVKKIHGDIVYIDTPYNIRQYGSNYHLLETIARYDDPKIHGVSGVRDYTDLKSEYSAKNKAKETMQDLLDNLKFTHVLLSYSTDGIISEDELNEMIGQVAVDGSLEVIKIPFKKYNSRLNKDNNQLCELLYYFRTSHQEDNELLQIQSVKLPSDNSKYIKSPLNYTGGKFKLLPQLIPNFPKHIDTMVDLFSGGGNVGINVDAHQYYFNDVNDRIIDMFKYFQNNEFNDILDRINYQIDKYHLDKENEEGFLKLRDDYNNDPDPLDLYVLSSYSFNYQIRFNQDMKYNNPFGRKRSRFSNSMRENLRQFVTKLHTIDATFTSNYFSDFDTSHLTQDSLVYVDPPYLISDGTYNDGDRGFGNWTQQQENDLYDFLDALNDRNIKFAMSNVFKHKGHVNQTVIDWAIKYNIRHLNANYSQSSYHTNLLGTDEVLITNY
ncbi:Dam family site-specific DNA-(adenine-N6)-methyltransferase [Companilactobacillus allii]|uniref:Site-specific DNA-methyltransferase (adenine-specific) n=2 Tax=Companilactobacillus allii TaxID=1847728 RepID=A0A1P8Q604_9LACO|nr:Dam family site-specific DNA-(adenine-N6)-methyltransferase [Companilactobacillus allii]APX73276.1 DNA adenine methylase [Companilactobacillus allii]USQ68091.1 Dam family site-specific DNA-(adenine-N6)-methyltransferase [Companilactobacillus allii]